MLNGYLSLNYYAGIPTTSFLCSGAFVYLYSKGVLIVTGGFYFKTEWGLDLRISEAKPATPVASVATVTTLYFFNASSS